MLPSGALPENQSAETTSREQRCTGSTSAWALPGDITVRRYSYRRQGTGTSMRLVLALSLVLTLTQAAKKFHKSEGIFVLTDKNYDAAVKEFEYLLVYFYAPW